ncbi:hypothetical protein Mapa_017654 [Marchantia paleacea]|nr:hypothetical protein Mapa_017654 [Marchantia paleacea]
MESACSVERGPIFTHARINQSPHKPSRATYSYLSTPVLSAKCANLLSLANSSSSAHRHVFPCTDGPLGPAVVTLTLTECFTKVESGRCRALAPCPSFQKLIRRKTSSVGRCYSEGACCISSRLVSFRALDLKCCGILDGVSRRAVHLDRKQSSTSAMLTMILSYRMQPQATVAQGSGQSRMGRRFSQPYGKRIPRGGYRHLCEASAQEDKGNTVPDDEKSDQNPSPVPKKDADSPGASPPESEPPESDWRSFRARLVVSEQQTSEIEETETSDGKATNNDLAGTLPKRWAHPILAPETGCVLIATDKIDGQQSFERSVILLLSPGSTNPREGPYGLILNRPLSCRIKDIKPKDRTLVKFFGNCQVHHGGPLDEDMFLLLHGTEGVKGYREVIPGVYYGAASGLEEIMRERRPLDYRFFFGYSGWSVDQLKKEIEQGLWCVAACSTDLITGHSAAGLWEEILLLMGGKYAELSKRPRRKHF